MDGFVYRTTTGSDGVDFKGGAGAGPLTRHELSSTRALGPKESRIAPKTPQAVWRNLNWTKSRQGCLSFQNPHLPRSSSALFCGVASLPNLFHHQGCCCDAIPLRRNRETVIRWLSHSLTASPPDQKSRIPRVLQLPRCRAPWLSTVNEGFLTEMAPTHLWMPTVHI
jgi:hypothetical protein